VAEQLRLLARIDELQLWKGAGRGGSGCRDCAQWMDRALGISRITALECLRVARALRDLTVIESLFALGKLSWSKVRQGVETTAATGHRQIYIDMRRVMIAMTVE